MAWADVPGVLVPVLVTADTFSGVWTYARELVTGLVTQGAQVMLVSFGEIPLPDQTAWMRACTGSSIIPPRFAWTGCRRATGFFCGAGVFVPDRARLASRYSPPQSTQFWRAACARSRA